ncbi:MAG: alkaline phosphatase family protein [Clostridia bacterium]|nr:alkaline phosphatase family protein [Clostridia bacterium]
MKKLNICLLALVLTAGLVLPCFAAQTTAAPYDRVFIIGVDGAGRFFNEADTPNFDRIFADGAVDYTARAEIITTSAQNWGAILTGVSYSTHALTNDILGSTERSSDTQYPTIFTYARRAFPDAELASFVNWNPINYGLIENDINVNKQHPGEDDAVTDAICDYFNAGNQPTLFFVQFDSVDHYGHESGSTSEAFINQIEVIDGYLGRIYDTAESNGLLENALFIVVADHGHTRTGGHGGLTMRETNVTLAVSGKGVVKGSSLDSIARNRDVAAIALYALGIERPAYMTSRIPANLFEGVKGETRPIQNDWRDGILSRLSWILTLITKPF